MLPENYTGFLPFSFLNLSFSDSLMSGLQIYTDSRKTNGKALKSKTQDL